MSTDKDKASPQLPNYFELFQNILNPFMTNPAHAGEGMANHAAAVMMASLDPKEIARKKQELETVLMWLKAQVGVVELSIKTLEYQHSLAEQFASASASMQPETENEKPVNNPVPNLDEFTKLASEMNPAAWAMKLMQQTGESPATKATKAKAAKVKVATAKATAQSSPKQKPAQAPTHRRKR